MRERHYFDLIDYYNPYNKKEYHIESCMGNALTQGYTNFAKYFTKLHSRELYSYKHWSIVTLDGHLRLMKLMNLDYIDIRQLIHRHHSYILIYLFKTNPTKIYNYFGGYHELSCTGNIEIIKLYLDHTVIPLEYRKKLLHNKINERDITVIRILLKHDQYQSVDIRGYVQKLISKSDNPDIIKLLALYVR
jgi:hypothetical protein